MAGCLSVGSPMYFRSGAQEFGEPGWWKLVHNKPPTMKPEGEKLSASALKVKGNVVRAVQDQSPASVGSGGNPASARPCLSASLLLCLAVLLWHFLCHK